MAGNRAMFYAGPLPAARHIVVRQPLAVKPILERSDGSRVLDELTMPKASEAWNFVVSCALAGAEGEAGSVPIRTPRMICNSLMRFPGE